MTEKEPYKFESHNKIGRVCGKPYCTKCGLIMLNNEFTRWCIKKGCNSEDHPSHDSVMKRMTGR